MKALGKINLSRPKLILAFATFVVLYAFIWSTTSLIQKYHTTLDLSQQQAALTTQQIAQVINDKLVSLTTAVNVLAKDLQAVDLNKESIEFVLKQSALNNNDFFALGVAFDLYHVSPQLRLFAPFIRHENSKIKIDRIDQYYDYIAPAINQSDIALSWFAEASGDKVGWLPPQYDLAYQQITLKYVRPLNKIKTDETITGVVFMDIDLDWIRQQVEYHDVGDNGYVIIVNEFKQTLYHGLKGSRKVISNLMRNESIHELMDFNSGQLGTNELTNRSAWLHRYPIGKTGWQVITVMNTEINNRNLFDEGDENQIIQKSDLIVWINTAVLLCLLLYAWLVILKHQNSTGHFLRHAFIVSLILAIGIIAIWVNEYYHPSPIQKNSLVLSNSAIVEQFKDTYSIASLNESKTPPLYVPTGLFIQSIEFLNATNLAVSGYVWQRFPKHYEDLIDHGVIFPESIQMTMAVAYEREEGDDLVKGWYFEATLREAFDYGVYPFDRQLLWIRLWHKKFTENITLIPDLKSFDSLNPNTLPGVEKDFVLSEWNLSRAFFDIRINKYNSNFGDRLFTSHDKVPELYYNIEISRSILNPFIAHLFPLIVVLLMLYALVLTISKQEKSLSVTGFNVSTVIGSCSALFFILLIMHVQLRDELAFNTIVYIEYFYLVSYLTILMVTVNAVLFAHDTPFKLFTFKDNLIPKLIYWPVLLILIFMITTILFY